MDTKANRRQAVLGGFGGLVAVGTASRTRTAAQDSNPEDDASGTGALTTEMADAATAFLASLDEAGRGRATYAFADEERQRWHWTTPDRVERNGLPLTAMSADQRGLALALLGASVSETGYQKALAIMSLQRDLGNDPEDYYVTVFGEPGGAEPWGWRYEGHHLSHHFAVVDAQVATTPFFLGAWPTVSAAGVRAMEREEDAARELANALLAAGQEAVVFQSESLTDHLTQNAVQVDPLEPVGVLAAEFDADQQALLLEIVETYLGVLPTEIATPLFDRIDDAGLDVISFGWSGSLEPGQPHYYRLQGPTFLLEFDNSRNSGTHIHSV